MSVNQVLVTEFMNLALEELFESHIRPTRDAHYHILKEWCEVYDDVPPRNRAETTILDALIEARDQLHAHARKLHPTV